MKVTRQELNEGLLEVDVEIDVKEVEEIYNDAYRSIAHEIAIPGFRKGKAPRRLVEARTSPDLLQEEATKLVIPKIYKFVVDVLDLVIIDQPNIDGELPPKEKSTFTMKVKVIPEVELGPYVDLKIPMETLEATPKDIEQRISLLQHQYSTLQDVEKDVVEKGDYLLLDYEGFLEGEPFPDHAQKNLSIQVGANTLIDQFEEGCVGLRVGEESIVTVTYPLDFAEENLAGKTIEYNVLVKEIKEKVLPVIDDDFVVSLKVKGLNTFHDLEDLWKKEITREKEKNYEDLFNKELLITIINSSTIPVTEAMINQELEVLMAETIQYLRSQGKMVDEKDKEFMDKLRESLLSQAQYNATIVLLLNTIAKKEGFTVEKEEVESKLEELAKKYKMDKKKYRRLILKENKLDVIKKMILREKALHFLKEHNCVIFQEDQEPVEQKKEEITDPIDV